MMTQEQIIRDSYDMENDGRISMTINGYHRIQDASTGFPLFLSRQIP